MRGAGAGVRESVGRARRRVPGLVEGRDSRTCTRGKRYICIDKIPYSAFVWLASRSLGRSLGREGSGGSPPRVSRSASGAHQVRGRGRPLLSLPLPCEADLRAAVWATGRAAPHPPHKHTSFCCRVCMSFILGDEGYKSQGLMRQAGPVHKTPSQPHAGSPLAGEQDCPPENCHHPQGAQCSAARGAP